jgi:hypothetical protein
VKPAEEDLTADVPVPPTVEDVIRDVVFPIASA